MTPGPAPVPSRRVLFVCTHNSARSQMAEGLLRAAGGLRVVSRSAGTERTRVHPLAVEAMDELGLDVRGHRSKTLAELDDEEFDVVVTVCDAAARSCPEFPASVAREHWPLPDPTAASGSTEAQLAAFRTARDELRGRIETLLARWPGAAPPHG